MFMVGIVSIIAELFLMVHLQIVSSTYRITISVSFLVIIDALAVWATGCHYPPHFHVRDPSCCSIVLHTSYGSITLAFSDAVRPSTGFLKDIKRHYEAKPQEFDSLPTNRAKSQIRTQQHGAY
jgi:hypothetical protein